MPVLKTHSTESARRAANVRSLRLAAERSGLRVSEYLALHGITRDQFLDGKRPANYGHERDGKKVRDAR